ncbi:GNAT family N-acetyltransferase [Knoellia sp. p5-6-4]|uniref:GNAT family N-acetyltransferase n=1 Tax=unclassified Knoellia TaxID=2618719 RepID=UPI0023DAD511|nr:GNAT family N-acetyltransferase [Knoellia sp. p5-6-4]MDF2144843.1 GNAT family N-acetyltransferase [Knoellia sp. p5-6-4]
MQIVLIEDISPSLLDGLAEVLADCVEGGASVGFLAPFTAEAARAWWGHALRDPDTLTWVATDEAGAVRGCVRLDLGAPANGQHRAEISKLLVHRRARGAGVATALMDAAEAEAARRGRSLLLLDTQCGSPAERLYARQGWSVVGVVDDYAALPDGRLAGTTIMAKRLLVTAS